MVSEKKEVEGERDVTQVITGGKKTSFSASWWEGVTPSLLIIRNTEGLRDVVLHMIRSGREWELGVVFFAVVGRSGVGVATRVVVR